MTVEEVESIRNSSPSKDSPAWRKYFNEMGKKCVLKRGYKKVPGKTDEMATALEHDNRLDSGEVIEIQATDVSRTEQLRGILGAKAGTEQKDETSSHSPADGPGQAHPQDETDTLLAAAEAIDGRLVRAVWEILLGPDPAKWGDAKKEKLRATIEKLASGKVTADAVLRKADAKLSGETK